VKLAVVLFNLGGPSGPEEIEPFLRNLFGDPAIIGLPALIRLPLARWMARRRAPVAREIYAKIGGRSPILEETQAQGRALQALLTGRGHKARVFIAMRCSSPMAEETAVAVKAWGPERVVLLPLYPQYSTTTTGSSLLAWNAAAREAGLTAPCARICCYPQQDGYVSAMAAGIEAAFAGARNDVAYRLLLSAHGLPERIVKKGDPYRWQVERSAAAIVAALDRPGLDWSVCYQSRVGPLRWIGPATDAEIRLAGAQGKGVIVAPIAFVSEHSETLVELDIDYAELARTCGVADYRRVRAVGTKGAFVTGLADLVESALGGKSVVTDRDARRCPQGLGRCGF
jgi:ferrochelatase